MSTVKVTIAGKDYNLNSQENDDYVIALARKLDKKIREVMDLNETLSFANSCMLVALATTDDLEKMSKDMDNLRFQLKEYIDETNKAAAKADELAKKVSTLEKINEQLSNELKIYTLKEKIDNK